MHKATNSLFIGTAIGVFLFSANNLLAMERETFEGTRSAVFPNTQAACSPPLSYHLLNLSLEYSQKYIDFLSKKNLSPSAFSKQPDSANLKNKAGNDLLKWQKKYEAQKQVYKNAKKYVDKAAKLINKEIPLPRKRESLTDSRASIEKVSLKKDKTIIIKKETLFLNQKKTTATSQPDMRKTPPEDFTRVFANTELKRQEEAFQEIQERFLGHHFPLTLKQIEQDLIYSPPLDLNLPYYKQTKTTKAKASNAVTGFSLEPGEVSNAIKMLERIIKSLKIELFIFKEIFFYYHKAFLPKVNSWRYEQLCNWLILNDIIKEFKKELKESIEKELKEYLDKEFPLCPPIRNIRSLANDREISQELIRLAQRLRPLYNKIVPFDEPTLSKEEEEKINSLYNNLPKNFYSLEGKSENDVLMPEKSASLRFSTIYKGLDQVTTKKENTNKLYKKPVNVSYAQIQIRQYIMSSFEEGVTVFIPPQGVKMVEEFRNYNLLNFHRGKWIDVLLELHINKSPVPLEIDIKSSSYNPEQAREFARNVYLNYNYDPHQIAEYNRLYSAYEEGLEKQRNLLAKLNPPLASYTYIPPPYTFFFNEEDSFEKGDSPPLPATINLCELKIRDSDLKIKWFFKNREGKSISRKLLENYYKVNLSYNELSNPSYELFYEHITKLDVSHNELLFLDFIVYMKNLRNCNVSHNQISSLPEMLNCSNLNKFDLSNNKIKSIQPLRLLSYLEELNLTGNQIMSLIPLKDHLFLRSLKVNHNSLEGYWREILPSGLTKLKILEISHNPQLNIEVQKSSGGSGDSGNTIVSDEEKNAQTQNFKIFFPALEHLLTKYGESRWGDLKKEEENEEICSLEEVFTDVYKQG